MPKKATTTAATKTSTKVPVLALADQKKAAEVELGWIIAATASPMLLAQVVHSSEQRQRIRRAHTKDRAEVRGGGKKPWRQKGTGRARAGSSRSPLWVGGGTTFGPRSRHEYRHRLPVSMRQRALRAAIGQTLRDERLQVIRWGATLPTKTRELAKLVPADIRSLLIVTTADRFKALNRVGANIPAVTVLAVPNLTVTDILAARHIWLDEEAISPLKTFGAWPTNA